MEKLFNEPFLDYLFPCRTNNFLLHGALVLYVSLILRKLYVIDKRFMTYKTTHIETIRPL